MRALVAGFCGDSADGADGGKGDGANDKYKVLAVSDGFGQCHVGFPLFRFIFIVKCFDKGFGSSNKGCFGDLGKNF